MRRFGVIVGISAVEAVAVACGLFPSVEGLTGGEASSLDGSVADAPGDGAVAQDALPSEAASPGCPKSGRGPAMVAVGAFCIDSTEVTMAQYAAFLADAGTTPSGQPTVCAWNTTLMPQTFGGCLYDPAEHPNLPVNCVDWCDARAFCAWSGKRLCGALAGGSVPFDAYRDAAVSEWQLACTKQGERAYPYGPTYSASAQCNGADTALGASPLLVDVGSRTRCTGGFSGVFDMSGNVWEWIDSCEPCDGGRCCMVHGGSYGNSAPNLACAPSNTGALITPEQERDLGVGFRCCAQ
jgi:formylglycine-generating enzyme